MIIKPKVISLNFLAAQTLDYCPPHETEEFMHGYLAATETFFHVIEVFSYISPLGDDSFEVIDWKVAMELIESDLDVHLEVFPPQNTIDFWRGIEIAFEKSMKTLEFAFAAPTPTGKIA